jgi:hypothetical protein
VLGTVLRRTQRSTFPLRHICVQAIGAREGQQQMPSSGYIQRVESAEPCTVRRGRGVIGHRGSVYLSFI